MSEQSPPQEDTPQAIEGTDAHWLADDMLKHKEWRLVSWRGTKLPSGKKVTKVMYDFVVKYIEYIERHKYINGGQVYFEQRVTMEKIDHRFWGSADVIQITKYNTLHVFDLKYGLWTVDPDRNSQMMSYAIGALTKYKHLVDLTKPVTGHICQPRPSHSGPFRVAKYSIDELIKFGNKAKAAIKESDGPNPKMVSGEHCVFCPAEFICPELNKLGRFMFVR